MRVQVSYTVPVEVVVDTDTNTVERVVVCDEAIKLDPVEGVRRETTLRKVPAPIADKARNIAESAEWPVWENGW